MPRPRASLALVLAAACARGPTAAPAPAPAPAPASDPVTLSIVGTSDLHGHVRALPLLAPHLAALRRARAADGAVLLLDAGDMFQGTLESNLGEGASVVAAYAALGYDAVTIGNHEFDFGPVGPRATAKNSSDDPRGALKARMAAAPFPFLSANIRRRDTGAHAELGAPSVLLERAGVKIGVIGVTTEATASMTIAANVADLQFAPLAATVTAAAADLRARGAAVVAVVAHAGGRCTDLTHPTDLTSCAPEEEIVKLAEALAPGSVDVIVAGHTHQAVAHTIHGVAVIQSYALGAAFGRVDLVVDRTSGHVLSTTIHPPRRLCSQPDAAADGPIDMCKPLDDRGLPLIPDEAIAAVIAPAVAGADLLRDRLLGPRLTAPFPTRRRAENPLGNFFTDLMLAARPGADAAILNGGGVRADLPAGPLRYGSVYEAFPFDNRFARVRLRAGDLAAMIAGGLEGRAFLSLGGLRAEARCERGALVVTLNRRGKPLAPDRQIVVLTSDFLATGGDRAFGDRPLEFEVEDDPPLREALVDQLERLGAVELKPADYFDPARPRIRAPASSDGSRVTCPP